MFHDPAYTFRNFTGTLAKGYSALGCQKVASLYVFAFTSANLSAPFFKY